MSSGSEPICVVSILSVLRLISALPYQRVARQNEARRSARRTISLSRIAITASTATSANIPAGSKLLVMTDGMFSDDGSAAPLADYLEILPQDALLLVDDAHYLFFYAQRTTDGRIAIGLPTSSSAGTPKPCAPRPFTYWTRWSGPTT